MKRKLIEMSIENSIQCDNKKCNFVIKSQTGDPHEDISMYVNVPCPKCGENLLTEKDHLQSLAFLKKVDWVNKWFSWLTYLSPRRAKEQKVKVHIHQGINVEKVG